MILVVEDSTSDKKNVLECISLGCKELNHSTGAKPRVEIGLTESEIKTYISKCRESDEPLMLIIDLQIDLKGKGHTKVIDITRECWEETGTYLADVPIIIYTSLSAMDNQSPRHHGWRVQKNPPPGKTINEEIQAAINKGLQALLDRWHRL